MKIALINENSQAGKNSMICESLKKIVDPWAMKFLIMVCTPLRMRHS